MKFLLEIYVFVLSKIIPISHPDICCFCINGMFRSQIRRTQWCVVANGTYTYTIVIFVTSWLGKMTGSHGKSCATQLGQQWISRWFVVRQCQAITWSTGGLQGIRSSRNHLVLYEKHRYNHIHGVFDELILHKYSTALIDAWGALLMYRKSQ